MRVLMVQGVSSDSGKSLVVTALCRWLRRGGVRVAPFKAQNMSTNARVGAGGELGSGHYLQDLAAGVEPDVRTNPGRSQRLWPHVEAAFEDPLVLTAFAGQPEPDLEATFEQMAEAVDTYIDGSWLQARAVP